MKVVFFGVGLVPYFNGILNRLNSIPDLEIINVVPCKGAGHITFEEGVYQESEGTTFEICKLAETKLFGLYPTFKGLGEFLRKMNPHTLVVSDYYLKGFLLHPTFIRLRRLHKLRLIMKSIPYRLPLFSERVWYPRKGTAPLKNLLLWLNQSLKWARAILESQCYQACDVLICYVEEGRAIYTSYGVPPERIIISYNSPDTDKHFSVRKMLETEGSINQSSQRLIHIGRLVSHKRVDLLIRSFARVVRMFPKCELLVVGEGPEKGRLIELAREMGVYDNISFVGGVYDIAVLGRFLLESTVYILAGVGGLSINDAMAFGKPIICSVGDGTEKKLVRKGMNGLYFMEGNEEDLANKIVYLLSAPEIVRRMGEESTRIIKEEVNVTTVINAYLCAFGMPQFSDSLNSGKGNIVHEITGTV